MKRHTKMRDRLHSRRHFLKELGLFGLALPLGAGAAPAARGAPGRTVLVSVFLRGGADALNMVVPYSEGAYFAARRNIAIRAPGGRLGALDLDGRFGLHPRLASLVPHFREGRLAIVNAVGRPAATRSHFEEQDVWDTGLPANDARSTGWINRHLAGVEGHGPVRAVCLGERLVRSLRGAVPAQAVADLADLSLRRGQLSRGGARALLEQLYGAGEDDLQRAGREALDAMRVLSGLDPATYAPANGAAYPRGTFGRRMAQAAQLVKAEVGVEVVACDLDGWDTHKSQGGALGQHANLCAVLGSALDAFAVDLGPALERTLVLVTSEFGRTLNQNGTGGTDHGRGGAAWLLGGSVAGGAILGRWPGLGPSALHRGRELQWTTDFRSILSEVLAAHLRNPRPRSVLPGFKPSPVGLFGSRASWTELLFGR